MSIGEAGYNMEQTSCQKRRIGEAMYKMVEREPSKHFIGEHIKFGEYDGRVIGIYRHFILCRGMFYNFTVSCKDLVMAGL